MINQLKRICILVLCSLCLPSLPAYCAKDEQALKLEKALMKYILSYEALQKAKQNPKQRKKLPTFIKKHREAYAQYTQLLRESDLYNPAEEDNDPAGKYNKKSTNKKKKWKTVDTKPHRKKIKASVEAGKEPEEISNEVESSLPTEAFSEDEEPEIIFSSANSNTTTNTIEDSSSQSSLNYNEPGVYNTNDATEPETETDTDTYTDTYTYPDCNINTSDPNAELKSVLIEYQNNKD